MFIGLNLLLVLHLHAEESDSVKVKKLGFSIGLKYLSNNVYLGRIDSANIMYLVPSVGYYHKSGLHIAASLSYQLDAGINKIDAIALEGGYDFKVGDNFAGGLTLEKYFYDMNSISLNSVNEYGVGSSFSYDFSFVSLNTGVGLAFNDKIDIITEAGLTRTFEIGKFAIEPSLKFFAGTQNFYNSYLVAGKSHLNGNKGHGGLGSIKKLNNSKSTTSTTSATTITDASTYTVEQASSFKILDYEISLPISYNFHNFKFDIVPTYAIPVNPATLLSSTGLVENEVISNHFILQLGVTYKFN